MKKILFLSIIGGLSLHANADDTNRYAAFQNFDNQVGFGLSFQQGNFSHKSTGVPRSGGNNDAFQLSTLNLEVEKLFDLGIWMDINIGNVQTYVEPNTFLTPLGAYPYMLTMNGKFGYNMPLLKDELSITPYILLGKNANLTQPMTSTAVSTNIGATQDFYYTTAGGARVEWLINKQFMVYFDQMLGYNFAQTGIPIKYVGGSGNGLIQTSNWQTTSTLGAKFNPWQNLQIGANMFYTTYAGYDVTSFDAYNNLGYQTGVPITQMGVLMSAGFTFK